MTAISYPDCEASSERGDFLLEARSPYNGAILHRDGSSPSEEEFPFRHRQQQDCFRYQLRYSGGGVVWERWQAKGEDSPRELHVSDRGWSLIVTHGFHPEVIVVSPWGEDLLHVNIGDEVTAKPSSEYSCNIQAWNPKRMAYTTAGHYWTGDSWPYFPIIDGRPHFALRTWWGQRLVIDLEGSSILTDEEQAEPSVAEALTAFEIQGTRNLLEALAPRVGDFGRWLASQSRSKAEAREEPDGAIEEYVFPKLWLIRPAIHLVGVHRIGDCIPYLRQWEMFDCPRSETPSNALPDCWLQKQSIRPIVHHSLRLLDEQPTGFPTYHHVSDPTYCFRIPIPERLPDRAELAKKLDRAMTAEQVLDLLGSPDHINRLPFQVGRFYRWKEYWDYDFRHESGWSTIRITWDDDRRASRMTDLEEFPCSWLETDERLSEILDVI